MSKERDNRNKIIWVVPFVLVAGWLMTFTVINNIRETSRPRGSVCVKHTAQSVTCYWENGDVEDLVLRIR